MSMFLRFAPVCFVVLFLLQPVAKAQDASELVVRLNQLESQMRDQAGQIEQLQHENRLLKEQLRQQGGNPAASPIQTPPPPPPQTNPGVATTPVSPVAPRQPEGGRTRPGDLFDPNSQPDAPGAPRQLGSTPPSSPLTEEELRGEGRGYRIPDGAIPGPGNESGETPSSIIDMDTDSPTGPQAPVGPSVAATGSGDPKADYDRAYNQFTRARYAEAEMSFRQFLQSHPRDELVPDARYWLGETYLSAGKPRDAAEQFLALTTENATSPKAPSGMLKLGTALTSLGAQDRACAIFAELSRKYPKASQEFKDEVEREKRRAKCP